MTFQSWLAAWLAGSDVDIRDLYGQYVHALRDDDHEVLADCFTADAHFWLEDLQVVGREQVQELLTRMASGRPRHLTCDLWVVASHEHVAHCRAQILLLDTITGAIVAFGTYNDVAVREADGCWRWRERRVKIDWAAESYSRKGGAPA